MNYMWPSPSPVQFRLPKIKVLIFAERSSTDHKHIVGGGGGDDINSKPLTEIETPFSLCHTLKGTTGVVSRQPLCGPIMTR